MEKWLGTITWAQLSTWRYYAELEPFGEERADLRAGYLGARLGSLLARTPQRVKDYVPDLAKLTAPRQPQRGAGTFAALKASAIAYATGRQQ